MNSRPNVYDEASSGSDNIDDESSIDEGVVGGDDNNEVPYGLTRNHASGSSGEGGSDDDNGTDSSDSDDDSGNSRDSDVGRQDQSRRDDSCEDEEELPLHEHVRRKEARGLSMHDKRERKSKALELACLRLAKMKEKTGKQVSAKLGKKKKSKHAPTEVSSKRSEFFRRGAPRLNESGLGVEIGAKRYKPLDPRTSSLSGHFNEEQFEKNYEFLEHMRNKEIAEIKKHIAARKVPGKKGKRLRSRLKISEGSLEDDEDRLKKMVQERADLQKRKLDRTAKQSVKKKIRTGIEAGTRGAYFLKRKERKQLEAEARLDEVRKRGGNRAVEKVLEKKRRKMKSRDASMFIR